MAKKTFGKSNIVYSTNPDFNPTSDEPEEPAHSLPDEEQKVRVILDRKQRAGKVVTLIFGFDHADDKIEKIGKELKKFCGTGGSTRDGEIIIQGDFRNKVLQWLLKNGYKSSKII